MFPLFADFSLPETFWVGTLGSAVFGVVGLFFLLGGFKLFDWILPKVDFQDVMKQSPVACAIIVAAFLLSLSHIVSAVVR